MYKLYDYVCPECLEMTEEFVDDTETVMCKTCIVNKERQIPAPMGLVKGTRTPFRYCQKR